MHNQTKTFDFLALMTQNIQPAAYDIYQATKKIRVLDTQKSHSLVLGHHPANMARGLKKAQ